jgi:hypothetical protein
MSGLPPQWADKDEITREDLLKAMEKLSHIIESEKSLDQNDRLEEYNESPEKFSSSRNKFNHKHYDGNYINEVTTISFSNYSLSLSRMSKLQLRIYLN